MPTVFPLSILNRFSRILIVLECTVFLRMFRYRKLYEKKETAEQV